MENNKSKMSVKFQGDMLNYCDFIQVFVFASYHHLKLASEVGPRTMSCIYVYSLFNMGSLQRIWRCRQTNLVLDKGGVKISTRNHPLSP